MASKLVDLAKLLGLEDVGVDGVMVNPETGSRVTTLDPIDIEGDVPEGTVPNDPQGTGMPAVGRSMVGLMGDFWEWGTRPYGGLDTISGVARGVDEALGNPAARIVSMVANPEDPDAYREELLADLDASENPDYQIGHAVSPAVAAVLPASMPEVAASSGLGRTLQAAWHGGKTGLGYGLMQGLGGTDASDGISQEEILAALGHAGLSTGFGGALGGGFQALSELLSPQTTDALRRWAVGQRVRGIAGGPAAKAIREIEVNYPNGMEGLNEGLERMGIRSVRSPEQARALTDAQFQMADDDLARALSQAQELGGPRTGHINASDIAERIPELRLATPEELATMGGRQNPAPLGEALRRGEMRLEPLSTPEPIPYIDAPEHIGRAVPVGGDADVMMRLLAQGAEADDLARAATMDPAATRPGAGRQPQERVFENDIEVTPDPFDFSRPAPEPPYLPDQDPATTGGVFRYRRTVPEEAAQEARRAGILKRLATIHMSGPPGQIGEITPTTIGPYRRNLAESMVFDSNAPAQDAQAAREVYRGTNRAFDESIEQAAGAAGPELRQAIRDARLRAQTAAIVRDASTLARTRTANDPLGATGAVVGMATSGGAQGFTERALRFLGGAVAGAYARRTGPFVAGNVATDIANSLDRMAANPELRSAAELLARAAERGPEALVTTYAIMARENPEIRSVVESSEQDLDLEDIFAEPPQDGGDSDIQLEPIFDTP